MHRQSLGSPSSKLHLHGGVVNGGDTIIADEPPKPHRLSSPPSPPNKFIHLIPILTLFCFFILYFFSHTPSPSELTHFNGFTAFKRSNNHNLAAEINGDIGVHYDDAKRSDVLAIRSLQQIPKSQLHRKLADF
ncbi:hypothetical protein MtrunA17_Chr5g0410811 [Medicago truncatula]|uniref:Transmembrane protein, putative n=1 Tax=Medicago truncatula TaxID=3880 RepID=G7KCF0_MEDTR|nr:uncharacterized protein LOC11430976 [Medicago truncatula]AES95795.2 transmembrane protein, putative [Medicago truncatula]RHN54801.1 hypothetical protein MtrunA17_Chr5g0410811 [Medicago truncatula]